MFLNKDKYLVFVLAMLCVILVGCLICSMDDEDVNVENIDKEKTETIVIKNYIVEDDFSKNFSLPGALWKIIQDYTHLVTKTTGGEIETKWKYELFPNSKYHRGGSIRFDQFDCSSAFWFAGLQYGSRAKYEPVYRLVERFEHLYSLGWQEKRKRYESVRVTDILVFKPKGKDRIWHIGWIIGKAHGYIYYVDFNGTVDGPASSQIKFSDYRIHQIYEFSLAYFMGDFFKIFKEQLEL